MAEGTYMLLSRFGSSIKNTITNNKIVNTTNEAWHIVNVEKYSLVTISSSYAVAWYKLNNSTGEWEGISGVTSTSLSGYSYLIAYLNANTGSYTLTFS